MNQNKLDHLNQFVHLYLETYELLSSWIWTYLILQRAKVKYRMMWTIQYRYLDALYLNHSWAGRNLLWRNIYRKESWNFNCGFGPCRVSLIRQYFLKFKWHQDRSTVTISNYFYRSLYNFIFVCWNQYRLYRICNKNRNRCIT